MTAHGHWLLDAGAHNHNGGGFRGKHNGERWLIEYGWLTETWSVTNENMETGPFESAVAAAEWLVGFNEWRPADAGAA